MKNPCRSSHNRFLSHLRFVFAVTLMSAAAALAFVSTAPPRLLVARKSPGDENTFGRFSKFRQDRDQAGGNKLAMPGPERDRGPAATAAAEEDYANRAYPATDIPFSATLNAQAAFNKITARGAAKKAPG